MIIWSDVAVMKATVTNVVGGPRCKPIMVLVGDIKVSSRTWAVRVSYKNGTVRVSPTAIRLC